jgi:hypothetical protein
VIPDFRQPKVLVNDLAMNDRFDLLSSNVLQELFLSAPPANSTCLPYVRVGDFFVYGRLSPLPATFQKVLIQGTLLLLASQHWHAGQVEEPWELLSML